LKPLTAQQIEEFHRNGFVIVPQLITPEEVQELLHDYERAVRGEIEVPNFGGANPESKVVQLAHPSRFIPGWQDHPYFQNARSAARQLLGDDEDYFYDQIIFKPPHTPGETHWHQDAGYWTAGPANTRALTCWLALGPAFPENGGMQFVSGSHLGPVREHHLLGEDATIANELATEPEDTENVYRCHLEPGDASFHHCRTLHYTGSNHSDVPRHGLVTHFSPPVP
jgi:ectoine hydroxylase-related dioxygenase (phytanoyl-CoA dioxygenase family)